MKRRFIGFFIICILLLQGCSLESLTSSDGLVPVTESKEESTLYEVPDYDDYDSEDTSIIESVSEINSTITFYNYGLLKSYTLSYNGLSQFYDKYGTAVSPGQLSKGDMVDIRFIKEKKQLVSLCESNTDLKLTGVTGFSINPGQKTFKYKNDVYKVTGATAILYDKRDLTLNDLDGTDEVSIVGRDSEIYCIVVNKSHGFLSLANGDYFVGGFIEISNKQIEEITEKMELTIAEGDYDVKISQKGNVITRKVRISDNEDTVIDLSDVEIEEAKEGTVAFDVTPSSAKLYVDGRLVDHTKLLTLGYGNHYIEAMADDYEKFSSNLKVAESSATMSIVLKETKNSETEKEVSQTDGAFVFVTEPTGVEVYFDGNYIGLSPVSFAKVSGTHTITIMKEGYGTRSFSVNLENNGKDAYYKFDLLTENSQEAQP